MKEYKAKMSPEKAAEMWRDYGRTLQKLRDACMKTKSATCNPSWMNKRQQKVIIVDIVGVMTEARLQVWATWIAVLLKDTHFKSKKGYVYRDGILRFFIAPDWDYYGLARPEYVLQPPPQNQGDGFEIDKELKSFTERKAA